MAIGIRELKCGIAIKSYQKDFMSVAQAAKQILHFLGYEDELLQKQLTVIAVQR